MDILSFNLILTMSKLNLSQMKILDFIAKDNLPKSPKTLGKE